MPSRTEDGGLILSLPPLRDAAAMLILPCRYFAATLRHISAMLLTCRHCYVSRHAGLRRSCALRVLLPLRAFHAMPQVFFLIFMPRHFHA